MAFGNLISGYLGNKAKQKLGKIDNPIVRRAVGGLLGNLGGDIFGGLASPPRNADSNLLFGARNLSELQLRNRLAQQSNQAAALSVSNEGSLAENKDWRARLRPKSAGELLTYRANASNAEESALLAPIIESGGLVFQYTPRFFISGTANYHQHDGQGMNYPIMSYINSTPPNFPVSSDFTANNIDEARYVLAVLTFLKVMTKSEYGDTAVERGVAGTPPPVLLFEYLGDHGFNKVPVVLRSYTVEYSDTVDYVPVVTNIKGKPTTTYVPTSTSVMIDLQPTYTPQKQRKRFDLKGITTGESYKDGFV